jgi:hypothetical protein
MEENTEATLIRCINDLFACVKALEARVEALEDIVAEEEVVTTN